MHYTALRWFHANTYYIKSAMKKAKQMCAVMIPGSFIKLMPLSAHAP